MMTTAENPVKPWERFREEMLARFAKEMRKTNAPIALKLHPRIIKALHGILRRRSQYEDAWRELEEERKSRKAERAAFRTLKSKLSKAVKLLKQREEYM